MNRPDLIYTEYRDADSFLATARAALERHEAANGLMLGLGLRLVDEPNAYGSQPYFATVESVAGLQVAALMTPPYKLQVHAEEDREWAGVRLVADALLRGGWPVPGMLAREAVAEAFAAIWHSKTGAGSRISARQRIYELRQVMHPRYPPGEFRLAAVEDVALVRQWACGFYDDCFGGGLYEQAMRSAEEKVQNGMLYLWVDGVPRSMAARTRPTPHGEAVGFVYTPPSQRRKGSASAVVARLSQRILDDGKQFCTLYTDLANPTSNRIYQQIGYSAIADVVEFVFEARP
jgi:predicted GNAT family acetyltransferase